MTATFELERFAWADGAFEVLGRWRAPERAPLGRARLVVEIDGRRRRVTAHGGRPTAGPDGVEWRGRFPHAQRPASVGIAELEVGGGLVIELPAPELAPEPPPDLREAEAVLDRLREERSALEAVAERLQAERAAAERAAATLAEARMGAEAAQEAARQAAGASADAAAARATAEATKAAHEEAERTAREVARAAAEEAVREIAERRPEPPAPPTAQLPTAPLPASDAPEPVTTRVPPPIASPRREAIRATLERPHQPASVVPRWLAYALALLIVILIVLLARLVL